MCMLMLVAEAYVLSSVIWRLLHAASAQYSDKFIGCVLVHLQRSYREERGGEWEAEKCSTSDVL